MFRYQIRPFAMGKEPRFVVCVNVTQSTLGSFANAVVVTARDWMRAKHVKWKTPEKRALEGKKS